MLPLIKKCKNHARSRKRSYWKKIVYMNYKKKPQNKQKSFYHKQMHKIKTFCFGVSCYVQHINNNYTDKHFTAKWNEHFLTRQIILKVIIISAYYSGPLQFTSRTCLTKNSQLNFIVTIYCITFFLFFLTWKEWHLIKMLYEKYEYDYVNFVCVVNFVGHRLLSKAKYFTSLLGSWDTCLDSIQLNQIHCSFYKNGL